MALPDNFSISLMRGDEVAILESWAADEGWNPGLNDLKLAYEIDPEAFIALREGPALVGGGTIFSYDGQFGFMGLFIMRPDMRGRGLGHELWHWRRDHLRERLAPGAAIGMDGVYDMVSFYERGGFKPLFRDVRYQGTAAGFADGTGDPDVVALGAADFDEIETYDRAFVPVPRAAFLRRWLGQPGAQVMGLRDAGALTGYGVARPCRVGFKIGPLFAENADVAARILDSLMAEIAGQQVQIDVPEVNSAGVDLAVGRGFEMVFGCVRLYLGPAPDLPHDKTFAVTSLEFG